MNNFCRYIDEDDMELLEYYCSKYDTDDLDEMSSWLNKDSKSEIQRFYGGCMPYTGI